MRQRNMEEVSSKSRLGTALLALFLGIFGVHRFYIGRTRTAIIMLTLSIFYFAAVSFLDTPNMFIPLAIAGLWALIDFMLTVAGIMKDREGRPIKRW